MAYGSPFQRRLYYQVAPPLQTIMANLYGFQHRRRSRGPHFRRWFQHLSQSQWRSAEQMRQMAFERLRLLLEFAYNYTAYYRELFEGLRARPADIRSLDDLKKLPVLTKECVRARYQDLIAAPYRSEKGTCEMHTSGTTGKALRILLTQECYQREYAYRALHYSWAGASLDDRCAMMAGHPVVHVDSSKPPFWRFNYVENRLMFSSQHLYPRYAREWLQALQDFRPVVIHGYPSTVAWVARAAVENNHRGIRPRAVFTSAETLLEAQRRVIEEAFACKVYNWYGNAEHIGCIIECPAGGLHIQPEHSWLEIVDEQDKEVSPGATGQLIATTLINFAMPLIRYALGDLVVASGRTCACRRQSPLVESVEGRVEDYLLGQGGRLFGRLDHIFKDMTQVSEAQIVQNEVGAALLRVVRRPGFSDQDRQMLLEAAHSRLGRDFRVALEFVDSIPRSASGKFQFIVNNLKNRPPHGIPAGIADLSQETRQED